jgi:hypothetical protein
VRVCRPAWGQEYVPSITSILGSIKVIGSLQIASVFNPGFMHYSKPKKKKKKKDLASVEWRSDHRSNRLSDTSCELCFYPFSEGTNSASTVD